MSTLRYHITSETCEEVHTITWEHTIIRPTSLLPGFPVKLCDCGIEEVCTEEAQRFEVNDATNRLFRLKIEYSVNNRSMNVYVASVTPVYVLEITSKVQVKWNTPFLYPTRSMDDPLHLSSEWCYYCTFSNIKVTSDIILDTRIKFKKCKNTVPSDNNLNVDFEKLFHEELFFDVTIKSSEGTEYKVHKGVLASRSAVFKAHFEHNTTECHTNVVESPFEFEVLKEVLLFIYSGKAPRVNNIPEKLLAAADYYQLNGLKNLSAEALKKKLNTENAIETLQHADLYSVDGLELVVLQYIKKNLKTVVESDGFKQLQSVDLMRKILEFTAK